MVLLLLSLVCSDATTNWPLWRGPNHAGSTQQALPVEFDETRNLSWRTPLEGRGHSTPIAWGDRIYLTSAVPTERVVPDDVKHRVAESGVDWAKPQVPDRHQAFVLWSIDRHDGKVIWKKALFEGIPHETTHSDGSWASASCATDGHRILTSFGSMGIFCTDMDGTLKWTVDLGNMRTRRGFGEGSSPAIFGDKAILVWDHEDQSFIVALDLKTGRELWRQDRDEPTTWATPLVATFDGKQQVIVPGTNASRGYDLTTGEVVWSLGGMTLNAIPSPIVGDGVTYLMSGFRGNAMQAVRLAGARGRLDGSDSVLWQYDRDTSYVPSALLHRGLLYVLKHNKGVVTCLDAESGEVVFGPVRLNGLDGVYASPLAAGDHIYVAGRDGAIAVFEAGREFKQVATNQIDDRIDASPVVSGDKLVIRGHRALYAFGHD